MVYLIILHFGRHNIFYSHVPKRGRPDNIEPKLQTNKIDSIADLHHDGPAPGGGPRSVRTVRPGARKGAKATCLRRSS